jgi:phage terminase small subunit
MGEVDYVAVLVRENPKARIIDLEVYADALRTYREAAVNIKKNGAVVFHPRTGAPIDNPYLKVQSAAGAVLLKMRSVKSDALALT